MKSLSENYISFLVVAQINIHIPIEKRGPQNTKILKYILILYTSQHSPQKWRN